MTSKCSFCPRINTLKYGVIIQGTVHMSITGYGSTVRQNARPCLLSQKEEDKHESFVGYLPSLDT